MSTSERICRRLILTLKMEGWTTKSAPIAISGQQRCSFSIFRICPWIRWTSASSRHYLEALISWIKEVKKPPQGKCLVFKKSYSRRSYIVSITRKIFCEVLHICIEIYYILACSTYWGAMIVWDMLRQNQYSKIWSWKIS